MVLFLALSAGWAETDVSCDGPAAGNIHTVPRNGDTGVPVDVVFSAATNAELCDDGWSFRLLQGEALVFEEASSGPYAFGRPAAELLPDTPYTLEVRVDSIVKTVAFTTGQGRAEPLGGVPTLENAAARWDGSRDQVELCASVVAVSETSSIAGYETTDPEGYWIAGSGGPLCARWYDRSQPEQVCAVPIQWGMDGAPVRGDEVCAEVERVSKPCGARTEPVAALLLLVVWPRRRR